MEAIKKGMLVHQVFLHLGQTTVLDSHVAMRCAISIANMVEDLERDTMQGASRPPGPGGGLFNLLEDKSMPPNQVAIYGGRRVGKTRLMERFMVDHPEFAGVKIKMTPRDKLHATTDIADHCEGAPIRGWENRIASACDATPDWASISLRDWVLPRWPKPRSGDMHQVADAERASVMQPVRKDFLG